VIRMSWPRPSAQRKFWNDGLVIHVYGGAEAPAEVRSAMRVMTRDLPRSVVDRAQLLATELVNTCIRNHNGGGRAAVRVDVVMPDDVVRVTVAESVPPRGLGLRIVEMLAERWGVSDDGRSVWFELPRKPISERELLRGARA
jgi:hypothetical protein